MTFVLLIIAFVIFLVCGELAEIRHNISDATINLNRIASALEMRNNNGNEYYLNKAKEKLKAGEIDEFSKMP